MILVTVPLAITVGVVGLTIAGLILADRELVPIVVVLIGIAVFAVSSLIRLGREYLAPAARSDPGVTLSLLGLLLGSFLPLWTNPFSSLKPDANLWQAFCFTAGVLVAVIGLTISGRTRADAAGDPLQSDQSLVAKPARATSQR